MPFVTPTDVLVYRAWLRSLVVRANARWMAIWEGRGEPPPGGPVLATVVGLHRFLVAELPDDGPRLVRSGRAGEVRRLAALYADDWPALHGLARSYLVRRVEARLPVNAPFIPGGR